MLENILNVVANKSGRENGNVFVNAPYFDSWPIESEEQKERNELKKLAEMQQAAAGNSNMKKVFQHQTRCSVVRGIQALNPTNEHFAELEQIRSFAEACDAKGLI